MASLRLQLRFEKLHFQLQPQAAVVSLYKNTQGFCSSSRLAIYMSLGIVRALFPVETEFKFTIGEQCDEGRSFVCSGNGSVEWHRF